MTVDLGNKPINIICRMGMVTRLQSNHFQALCSFVITFHSTWPTVHNQPPGQAKDIQVMGHSGKDMTSTKVVMVGFKCFPLHTPEQGPSSPGAPRVAPELPENHQVNRPTSSTSNHLPEHPSGASGRPPISLLMKWFHPPAYSQKTDVAKDCRPASIEGDVLRQLWCRWWERRFVGRWQCRRLTAYQPEAHWILLEAICQKIRAGQLQCVQQVKGSKAGWVLRKKASVHDPGAKHIETGSRWTPAQEDGGCRFFGDIWELATIG